MQIARQSMRGSFLIFLGNVVSAGATAVTLILVARLLGPGEYGLFALAVVSGGVMQLFTGWGASVATSRQVAHLLALGDIDGARKTTTTGFVFVFATAATVGVLGFLFAPEMANLLGRAELAPEVRVVTLMVIGQAALQVGVSAANGWGSMGLGALADIVQGASAVLLTPILVLEGYGLQGAVLGYSLSFLIGGVAVTLLVSVFRGLERALARADFTDGVRKILQYGGPAYVGTSLNQFSNYFATIVLAYAVGNAVLGAYQAAVNVTAAITLVTMSVAPALLPAFARLTGLGLDGSAGFRMAVKYVSFLVLPIIFSLALASREFVLLLLGHAYEGSIDYLVFLSLAYLPVAIGFTVLQSYLNGVGNPRKTLQMLLVDAGVLILLAPILGLYLGLGVPGIILAVLLSNLASALAGLHIVHRLTGRGIDYPTSAKMLATVAGTYVLCSFLPPVEPVLLALAVKLLAYWVIFLTLIPLTRSLKAADFHRLEDSASGLPGVSWLVRQVMRYEIALVLLTDRPTREGPGSESAAIGD